MKDDSREEIFDVSTKLLVGTEVFKRPRSFYEKFKNNFYIKVSDGTEIGAFLYENEEYMKMADKKEKVDCLLFLHGSGTERYFANEYLPIEEILHMSGGPFVLLVIDYRHFADSNEKFTKKGVCLDIDAGYNWLMTNYNVNKITFVAHSFGCAITSEYFKYKNTGIVKDYDLKGIYYDENDSESDFSTEDGSEGDKNELKNKIDDFVSTTHVDEGKIKLRKDIKVILLAPFSKMDTALEGYFLSKIYKMMFSEYYSFLHGLFEFNVIDNVKYMEDVTIYHGLADSILPVYYTEEIQKKNSHVKTKYFKEKGHCSILTDVDVWTSIFSDIYK